MIHLRHIFIINYKIFSKNHKNIFKKLNDYLFNDGCVIKHSKMLMVYKLLLKK